MSEDRQILHQEQLRLQGTVYQLRSFITDPACIMDYYPLGIEGKTLEPGRSLVCRGWTGVSLLEVIEEQSSDPAQGLSVHMLVTSALLYNGPYSPERIKRNAFFTMVERWTLKPEGQHTVLQKTWYQPEQLKWRWLPIARLVLLTAAAESDKLRKAWDRRCASDSNPSSA